MAQSAPLFQLGIDLGHAPRNAQTEGFPVGGREVVGFRDHLHVVGEPSPVADLQHVPNGMAADHFVIRDGRCFAGTHLIIDLWGAERLDELAHIEAALRQAVDAAGATLLHIHLHHFTPNGGVSGVAVLAESHISIHTWPERGYAALDVFMCGAAEPQRAIPVLEAAFRPDRTLVNEILRGEVDG